MAAGRVLIINSFDGGEMYATYLRYQRFEVRLFKRPEEALEKFECPDVVVTDVVFTDSDVDGLTFIRHLRQLGPKVPIVVVSGYVRAVDRQAVRKAGASRFLMKPCLPAALLMEIEAILETQRRGERLMWNWPNLGGERRRQRRRQRKRRRSSSR
jgi:DNA-binding response OmpR family regulator